MKNGWLFFFTTLTLGSAITMAVPDADQLGRPIGSTSEHKKSVTRLATTHNGHTPDNTSLPLNFEANRGQATSGVKFLARGNGYTLLVTPEEFVVSLPHAMKDDVTQGFPLRTTSANRANKILSPEGRGSAIAEKNSEESAVVRFRWMGANQRSQAVGEDKLPGSANYFIGNDARHWVTDVPTFSQVRLKEVYPGTDLIYYGKQGRLEYDFVLAPGRDPRAIRLAIEGAKKLAVNPQGDLVFNLLAPREIALRDTRGLPGSSWVLADVIEVACLPFVLQPIESASRSLHSITPSRSSLTQFLQLFQAILAAWKKIRRTVSQSTAWATSM